MDKIAAYELLLEEDPLWNKEAGAQAAAYKKFKPLILKGMNARSPGELADIAGEIRQANKLPPGTKSPLTAAQKRVFSNMQSLRNAPAGTREMVRRSRLLGS